MADPIPTEPPPSYTQITDGTTPPPVQRPILPLNLPVLVNLRGKRVILASQSPRRKAILAQTGLRNFEIVPSTFAENLSKDVGPFEYVLQTATNKAMKVYHAEIDSPKGEPALVIAADTIIVSNHGLILEKPSSQKHHMEMLKMLRDTGSHRVYTAVVMMRPLENAQDPGYKLETHVEETKVKFDATVTDDLLFSYVKTREGIDKAGGYGIQGLGSILIEGIEGSFDNVVGLPLRATLQLIEKTMLEEDMEEEDIIDFDG